MNVNNTNLNRMLVVKDGYWFQPYMALFWAILAPSVEWITWPSMVCSREVSLFICWGSHIRMYTVLSTHVYWYIHFMLYYTSHIPEKTCASLRLILWHWTNQIPSKQIAQKHPLESQHPLYLRSISQIRSHPNLAIHPIAAQLGIP